MTEPLESRLPAILQGLEFNRLQRWQKRVFVFAARFRFPMLHPRIGHSADHALQEVGIVIDAEINPVIDTTCSELVLTGVETRQLHRLQIGSKRNQKSKNRITAPSSNACTPLQTHLLRREILTPLRFPGRQSSRKHSPNVPLTNFIYSCIRQLKVFPPPVAIISPLKHRLAHLQAPASPHVCLQSCQIRPQARLPQDRSQACTPPQILKLRFLL